MEQNPNEEEETTSTSPSDETENPSDDFDFKDDLKTDDEDAAPRKRSAEARINQLVAKNKELEDRLNHVDERTSMPSTVPTPPIQRDQDESNPEVKKALDFLKQSGFTTKEDLTKGLQEIEDRRILDTTHRDLEGNYDGQDGRPKYRRSEVEEYMRTQGIYNPEVAYKALHEEELLDWQLKRAEGKRKERPYVQAQGASTGDSGKNTITREKIAKAMLTPEGKAWYERNRTKILQLSAEGKLQ